MLFKSERERAGARLGNFNREIRGGRASAALRRFVLMKSIRVHFLYFRRGGESVMPIRAGVRYGEVFRGCFV